MMKKILVFALFLGLQATAMAQNPAANTVRESTGHGLEKNKAVYLELMGASNLVGVNYDARFNDHTRFGWRTGLNFGYGRNSSIFWEGSDVRGYAVPLEVNYLLGSQKNNLEVGVGTSVGIYNLHGTFLESADGPKSSLTADQQKHAMGEYNTPEGTKTWLVYNESRNKIGYYFFGNIGYRHVSRKGFLFRAGFSPSFTFGEKNAVKKTLLYPYLGFGWAF